jgi:hypothetical protein
MSRILAKIKTNNFLDDIRKDKKLFKSILISCILILLHAPIEKLFQETVIENIFKHIEKTALNDFIIVLLNICLVISILKSKKGYLFTANFIFIVVILFGAYLYYRLKFDFYFTRLYALDYIAYIDIFFLSSLILAIKLGPKKNRITYSKTFSEEKAIKDPLDDKLGYSEYAKTIANKLNNNQFENSFCVAINGKWGSGKTSFLQLLQNNLIEKNSIQFFFKAWQSDGSASITNDFFKQFEEQVNPYYSGFSKPIIEYANKLSSVKESAFLNTIKIPFEIFNPTHSIDSIRESINKSLKRLGKRVIVYIDDLDRLDKNEIVEVLRLIRNNANFYNTIFIVAYDKNYVTNSLKNFNDYNYLQFLEKIFSLEISLPQFDKSVITDTLFVKLKNQFEEKFHSEIDTLSNLQKLKGFIPKGWVDSFRDVNRLINSMIINIENLKDDVSFFDFLLSEILRMKFPSVWGILYKRADEFFSELNSENLNERARYTLSFHDNNEGSKTNLQIHLQIFHFELQLDQLEIEIIIKYIAWIFSNRASIKSGQSITLKKNFYKYFTYSLAIDAIPSTDILQTIKLPTIEWKKKVDGWIQNKQEMKLLEGLTGVSKFQSLNDFENTVKIIFYITKQYSVYNRNSFVHFDIKDFWDLVKKANKLFTNLDKQSDILKELFVNAETPYVFQSNIITAYAIYDPNSKISFALKHFVIEYTFLYLNSLNRWDWILETLYLNSKNIVKASINTNSDFNQTESNFLNLQSQIINMILYKNLASFIQDNIRRDFLERDRFYIGEIVSEIFESNHEFLNKLNHLEHPDKQALDEIKSFVKKFIDNDSIAITFEFKSDLLFNQNI